MNFLGKVFVVIILVMSVIFMTLAMAMYATHTNWRVAVEGPGGLEEQLRDSKARYDRLKTENNRLEEQLTGEIEANLQQIRKLETELAAVNERNFEIQNQRDLYDQQLGEATAAVAATQQNNQRLADEVSGLRGDIRENQQARDQAFATTLASVEELHQTKGQLDSALERTRQLTRQVANMTMVMRESGLDPGTEAGDIIPRIDGFVTRVKQSGGAQLVEVTIGADDGLKPGHTVEVFRGDKYLGRVEILRTSPDKSVGRVDRRFQQGQIQEGDRVATHLDVG